MAGNGNIGIAALCLLLLACDSNKATISKVVGNWEAAYVNRKRVVEAGRNLMFHENHTFSGWLYNSDGFFEAAGIWSVDNGNSNYVRITFSKDGVSITRDLRFNGELTDCWLTPYDEVKYSRSMEMNQRANP